MATVNWVDWICIGLIVLCTLHGGHSGTLKQAFILVRILLAFLIATAVHVMWLPPSLVERGEVLFPSGTLYAISLAVLYLLAWIALYLVFFVIRMILPQDGELDAGQRIGGALLGFLRGLVLVFLVILLIDYSMFATRSTWHESSLRTTFSPYAQELRRGIMWADDLTREHIELLMRAWQPRQLDEEQQQ